MPPHFKRAVIYGVGLLGGSLGLAMRRRHMADEIVGLGRSRKRLERALQLGALDRIATDPAEALDGADALILCLPPRLIRRRWTEIAGLIAPGCFVTDVGSVKETIVNEAHERLDPSVLFIGSHPMAGSEKSGAEAARGDLFESAACFVTPGDATPARALPLAVAFWRALGSRVVIMDPSRHDRLMAGVSHLPHLCAVSLVQSLYANGDATLFLRAIVGRGFLDTTRIAAGPADVWEQIFTENSAAMVQGLDRLIDILKGWREALDQGDGSAQITDWLTHAADRRRELADTHHSQES